MRNLAKIVLSIAACLVMTNGAAAVDLSMPFVSVSLPRTPINVGGVWGPGLQEVTAEFDAHVVANCAYHLSASFREFKHQKGKATLAGPEAPAEGTEAPAPGPEEAPAAPPPSSTP